MVKKTMEDVIRANKKAGQHWFDEDTMRFFKSDFGKLYSNKYFISSEKSPHNPRRWSIRKVNWKTGDVDTVGEFQQFSTQASAKRYLREKMKLKDVI